MKELNIKSETTKILEENRKNFHDIGFPDDYLDMTPKAQQKKTGVNWTSSKLNTSSPQMPLSGEGKGPVEQGNILHIIYPTRESHPGNMKNPITQNKAKIITQNMGKGLE